MPPLPTTGERDRNMPYASVRCGALETHAARGEGYFRRTASSVPSCSSHLSIVSAALLRYKDCAASSDLSFNSSPLSTLQTHINTKQGRRSLVYHAGASPSPPVASAPPPEGMAARFSTGSILLSFLMRVPTLDYLIGPFIKGWYI